MCVYLAILMKKITRYFFKKSRYFYPPSDLDIFLSRLDIILETSLKSLLQNLIFHFFSIFSISLFLLLEVTIEWVMHSFYFFVLIVIPRKIEFFCGFIRLLCHFILCLLNCRIIIRYDKYPFSNTGKGEARSQLFNKFIFI